MGEPVHEPPPVLPRMEDNAAPVRSLRDSNALRPPARYCEAIEVTEPKTFSEAMTGPWASEWHTAAQEEYDSLTKMGVWELQELPPGRKAIGNKWVFKVKRDADGTIKRFKARLVAQGFLQRFSVDYTETYAPVASLGVTRLLIAAAVYRGWHVHQADIETAYLNGDVEEEIYMVQPLGFIKPGEENKVCRLKRSLYGLKQSGRCWNRKLNTKFLEAGFIRILA